MTTPAGRGPHASAGRAAPADSSQTLHLARWTINSGSNVQSRGAVVIASGDHQWEAKAEGNGPVDALYRAVDRALHGVLTGHPRLVAYDVHAVSEGPESEGIVKVQIAPPSTAAGARASGRYRGEARSANIIAASVEAYLEAINRLLAEEHWAGATEEAGNRKRARSSGARAGRAEIDKEAAEINVTDWFNR
jgi:2-isopropylmalate synthase